MSGLPDAETTIRLLVLFEIDDAAKPFTVRLNLGSARGPEADWQDVEVQL